MIPVRVHGIGMSPHNQGFVALLMDDTYNQWLPIYIGSFEAQAIAMELDDVEPPRPMSHDLMATLIEKMNARVTQVVVNALKDSTYYAEITLTDEDSEQEHVIDARPSDSIALALRVDADIFVEEDVMQEAAIPADAEEEQPETEEAKRLKILQHRLQRAVEEEEFEEAADLRDEIRNLQSEVQSGNGGEGDEPSGELTLDDLDVPDSGEAEDPDEEDESDSDRE